MLKDPTIKLVGVVHVETSRGTMNPIAAIGRMLKAEFPEVIYLVNSVSGLAATDLRLDEWGIDICCTSSQKAVNAPQGVAIVAVSPKAWQVMEKRKTPIYGLCLDLLYWRRYHQGAADAVKTWNENSSVDVSFSQYKSVHGPSQSYVLIKGLNAALDEILAEGLDHVLTRHKITARALRAGIRAMGLKTLASEENAAPDSTCALVAEERFDVKFFMRTMWEDFGVATAGGSPSIDQQEYAGFRVGTMGFIAQPRVGLCAPGCSRTGVDPHGLSGQMRTGLTRGSSCFCRQVKSYHLFKENLLKHQLEDRRAHAKNDPVRGYILSWSGN